MCRCVLLVHALIRCTSVFFVLFFFNDTATTEIYTLSLHYALPISRERWLRLLAGHALITRPSSADLGSEEHTSELQSHSHLVCRLLLEKKKKRLLPSLWHAENRSDHDHRGRR